MPAKLILAAFLVAVNAFFVIAEYALVRSRRARLEVMREQGLRGAALALSQHERINEYISAVQIGVTMTSIAIGALATPTLAHALQDAFGGGLSHDFAVVLAVVLAYAVVIFVQLIFGEMVPKFYAIDRAESVARRVARPLQGFSVLFRPLIRAITAISARLLKLFGVDMGREPGGGSPTSSSA